MWLLLLELNFDQLVSYPVRPDWDPLRIAFSLVPMPQLVVPMNPPLVSPVSKRGQDRRKNLGSGDCGGAVLDQVRPTPSRICEAMHRAKHADNSDEHLP